MLEPLTYGAARARAGVRYKVSGGPAPRSFLLVTDNGNVTSEQQWAPLRRWRSKFRQELGLVFRWMDLAVAQQLSSAALSRWSVVGLKLSWQKTRVEAVAATRSLRERLDGTTTRLVYFDGDDDLCVQWPEVLKLCDLYVKKQVFADPSGYLVTYTGKCNLTDYVARTFGESFADNHIPASGLLQLPDLGKLFLDWNLALGDTIVDMDQRLRRAVPLAKDVDIVCRAAIPQSWLRHLRQGVLGHLQTLARTYRVIAPDRAVTKSEYEAEMRRSRICVSPFGYGELCWRDFEAILCGCLLVKPDMSHVRTRPDLFEAGVTYVPVRWDYSDLAEVCARYLADENARRAIADRALVRLRAQLEPGWCVGVYRELMDRLA